MYQILLSRLQMKSPSFLCLFSWERCFSPLIIFVALCGSWSSKSMSFFYWGAQNCAQHLGCWVERWLPWICWQCSAFCQEAAGFLQSEGTSLFHSQPVVHWHPLFLSAELAGPSTPCIYWYQGYSSPDAGLLMSHCWISWGSCPPNSPACSGLSEWQHNTLVFQPLILVFCLQICWVIHSVP